MKLSYIILTRYRSRRTWIRQVTPRNQHDRRYVSLLGKLVDTEMLQEVVEDIRASTGGALVMLFTRSRRKGSIHPLVMSEDVSAGECPGPPDSSHRALPTQPVEHTTPINS